MPTVVQDVSGDSALQTAIAALKAKIEAAEESEDISSLNEDITNLSVRDLLLLNEIPGTVQTVTFDANDNPSTITHSISGVAVRTDVFTWESNNVTEVRTLSSGKYITITTNLMTLEQTISEISEVA